jgi:hypothetical protein
LIDLENSNEASVKIDLGLEDYSQFLIYLKNNLITGIDKSYFDIYLMALNKRIPTEWGNLLKEFKFSLDPDYQTYLKLKNKFEK